MIASFLLLTIGLILMALCLTRQLHCTPIIQYHYIARSPYDMIPASEKPTVAFSSMFAGPNLR